MAGIENPYASSKAWHQELGDYNDNVIVPKSLLIDTADAIRLKRDGTSEITAGLNDTVNSSNAIEPVNFASEIANIVAGSNLINTELLERVVNDSGSSGSSTSASSMTLHMSPNGNNKAVLFSFVAFNESPNSSTFHSIAFWVPSCAVRIKTINSTVYYPLYHIRLSGASSNTYVLVDYNNSSGYYVKKSDIDSGRYSPKIYTNTGSEVQGYHFRSYVFYLPNSVISN